MGSDTILNSASKTNVFFCDRNDWSIEDYQNYFETISQAGWALATRDTNQLSTLAYKNYKTAAALAKQAAGILIRIHDVALFVVTQLQPVGLRPVGPAGHETGGKGPGYR